MEMPMNRLNITESIIATCTVLLLAGGGVTAYVELSSRQAVVESRVDQELKGYAILLSDINRTLSETRAELRDVNTRLSNIEGRLQHGK